MNEVDQSLASWDMLLWKLKANLYALNNKMKQVVDVKRWDIEFQEGDMVFLKLHSYRKKLVFKRAYKKLVRWFYRPFQVEKRVGKVAYKLKLP